jgi:uncharacterized protein
MKRKYLLAVAASLALPACGQVPAATLHGENTSNAAPAIVLQGRVTDSAGLLTPAQVSALADKLATFERETAHQMVVVTVRDLHGRDIADFTRDLANNWGIGRKDHDDGVVILLAANDRRARIAVGIGLEEELPDELCQLIMNTEMVPHFQTGDYYTGLDRGTAAIIAKLDHPTGASP